MRFSRNSLTFSRLMISAGTWWRILKPVMSCRSCRTPPISLKISRAWPLSDWAAAMAARSAARAKRRRRRDTLQHLLEDVQAQAEDHGGADGDEPAGKDGEG